MPESNRHWTPFTTGIVVALLAGCSTLPAGRGYTMAKTALDARLVESRRSLPLCGKDESNCRGKIDSTNELDRVAPNGTIGIKLNAGYVRYLESIKRAHVAVFSRAVVRNPGEVSNGLVWEAVFTPNKDEKVQTVIDKDTTLPFQDVDILPAIDYSGQDITVELRVVSMKQEDNERLKALLSAAAAGAAFAKPEAAAAISVFQAVLTFLVENRPDVIEFAFNFKVSPEDAARRLPGAPGLKDRTSTELSLTPRVGTYAIIKTEHEGRFNYPSDYLGFASDGIRYVLAEVLKLGTLGIANWPIWSGPRQEDTYLLLFGRPFSVDRSSWLLPEWKNGVLTTSANQWTDWNFAKTQDTSSLPTRGKAIRLLNGALYVCPNLREPRPRAGTGMSAGFSADARNRCVAYREQSYLTLSIVSPLEAIPFDVVKGAADQQKAIDELGIRTTWMSPADQAKSLQGITDSLKGFVAERALREKCQNMLAAAQSADEIATAKKSCGDEATTAASGLTKETNESMQRGFQAWLDKRSKRRQERLDREQKRQAERDQATGEEAEPQD